MSELDEMTIAIAVGGLLLLAMIGGFMLMWQRQRYLHAALELAWTARPAEMTLEQTLNGQRMTPLPSDSQGSPELKVTDKSQRALEERESGINPQTHIIAPLSDSPGSKRENYRKGSEEERLRIMLAGRPAIRPNAASPPPRPGSP